MYSGLFLERGTGLILEDSTFGRERLTEDPFAPNGMLEMKLRSLRFNQYGDEVQLRNRLYQGEEIDSIDQLYQAGYIKHPGDWQLFIPHWLMLLAVALLWSALLLGRARRRKKLFLNGGLMG